MIFKKFKKYVGVSFAIIFAFSVHFINGKQQNNVVITDDISSNFRVIDGDTLCHIPNNDKIRLYGIDCPEMKQDFGTNAKQITKSVMEETHSLRIENVGKDKYGRTVAIVGLDAGSITLQEVLLKNGAALVYRDFCHLEDICQEWVRLEIEARQQKRGLWADKTVTPPWVWRHKQKSKSES